MFPIRVHGPAPRSNKLVFPKFREYHIARTAHEVQMNAARHNNATEASVDMQAIFASGGFKDVYRGIYTKGNRTGQLCVHKCFRSGAVYENSFFDHELDVVTKAMEIINKFNAENVVNPTVYLNQPEIWKVKEGSSFAGQKVIVEPMIKNFVKYNSNSGWTPQNSGVSWTGVMQALSHFSYHASGGAFVLCDLQGGSYGKDVVLTDPVILSRDHRFGPTDLGPKGITTFFSQHVCNQYCRGAWTKPAKCRQVLYVAKGTSMCMPPPKNG